MRVDDTPTNLTFESAPPPAIKAFGLLFTLMAVLSAGVLVLNVVAPPNTVTIVCDRAAGTCVASARRRGTSTYPIANIARFVVDHVERARDGRSWSELRAQMRDGRRLDLGQRGTESDLVAAMTRSAAEVNRFLDDPTAARVSTTFQNNDSDYVTGLLLALASAIAAWATLRLSRGVRVDIDRRAKSLRVRSTNWIGTPSDDLFPISDVTKIRASTSPRRGWAYVHLERRDGKSTLLVAAPRLGAMRSRLNALLGLLQGALGVEVDMSPEYQTDWA